MIKSYNYSSLYKVNMPYFYHILYCISAIFPFLNLLNSSLIFSFYIFSCLVTGLFVSSWESKSQEHNELTDILQAKSENYSKPYKQCNIIYLKL